MKVSEKGIELIKHFESFSPKMYICAAGCQTIGYGTVIDTKEEEYLRTSVLTPKAAEELLKIELEYYQRKVSQMVKPLILQCQFDALVSFAFNCGLENLRGSTLLKKVNTNPKDPSIPVEFGKWKFANGKVLAGLQRRRAAEAFLYMFGELKFNFE